MAYLWTTQIRRWRLPSADQHAGVLGFLHGELDHLRKGLVKYPRLHLRPAKGKSRFD